MNKSINLYPTPPAVWLWRDHAEDIKREFLPSATIPAKDESLWHECTDADKAAYEAEQAALRSATEASTDTTEEVEPSES